MSKLAAEDINRRQYDDVPRTARSHIKRSSGLKSYGSLNNLSGAKFADDNQTLRATAGPNYLINGCNKTTKPQIPANLGQVASIAKSFECVVDSSDNKIPGVRPRSGHPSPSFAVTSRLREFGNDPHSSLNDLRFHTNSFESDHSQENVDYVIDDEDDVDQLLFYGIDPSISSPAYKCKKSVRSILHSMSTEERNSQPKNDHFKIIAQSSFPLYDNGKYNYSNGQGITSVCTSSGSLEVKTEGEGITNQNMHTRKYPAEIVSTLPRRKPKKDTFNQGGDTVRTYTSQCTLHVGEPLTRHQSLQSVNFGQEKTTAQSEIVSPDNGATTAFLGLEAGHRGNGHHGNLNEEISMPVSSPPPRPPCSPTFLIGPRRQLADCGGVARFRASCDGEPVAMVTWERDGRPLQQDTKYKIYQRNTFHFLEVMSVAASDAGTYTCVVTNELGTDRCDAQLEVYTPPRPRPPVARCPPVFVSALRDTVVSPGDTARLDCLITGHPRPFVQWTFDGHLLRRSPGVEEDYGEDGRASLTISGVAARHAGKYECVASNAVQRARSGCALHVPAEKAKFSPHTTSPQKLSTRGDSPIKLHSEALYKSKLESQKHLIKPSVRSEALRQLSEARLARHGVRHEAQGDAPVFTKRLRDQTVRDGDRVEMEVHVTGREPVTVSWRHDDQAISPDNRVYETRGRGDRHWLVIRDAFPEDAGRYTCEARSAGGRRATECVLSFHECLEVEIPEVFPKSNGTTTNHLTEHGHSATATPQSGRTSPQSGLTSPQSGRTSPVSPPKHLHSAKNLLVQHAQPINMEDRANIPQQGEPTKTYVSAVSFNTGPLSPGTINFEIPIVDQNSNLKYDVSDPNISVSMIGRAQDPSQSHRPITVVPDPNHPVLERQRSGDVATESYRPIAVVPDANRPKTVVPPPMAVQQPITVGREATMEVTMPKQYSTTPGTVSQRKIDDVKQKFSGSQPGTSSSTFKQTTTKWNSRTGGVGEARKKFTGASSAESFETPKSATAQARQQVLKWETSHRTSVGDARKKFSGDQSTPTATAQDKNRPVKKWEMKTVTTTVKDVRKRFSGDPTPLSNSPSVDGSNWDSSRRSSLGNRSDVSVSSSVSDSGAGGERHGYSTEDWVEHVEPIVAKIREYTKGDDDDPGQPIRSQQSHGYEPATTDYQRSSYSTSHTIEGTDQSTQQFSTESNQVIRNINQNEPEPIQINFTLKGNEPISPQVVEPTRGRLSVGSNEAPRHIDIQEPSRNRISLGDLTKRQSSQEPSTPTQHEIHHTFEIQTDPTAGYPTSANYEYDPNLSQAFHESSLPPSLPTSPPPPIPTSPPPAIPDSLPLSSTEPTPAIPIFPAIPTSPAIPAIPTSPAPSIPHEATQGEAPFFIKKPKSATVTAGEIVRIVAEVEGQPAPEVDWLKDGRTLRGTDRLTTSSQGPVHTLTVTAAHPSDSGAYACRLSSPAGTDKCSFTVLVKKSAGTPAGQTDFRNVLRARQATPPDPATDQRTSSPGAPPGGRNQQDFRQALKTEPAADTRKLSSPGTAAPGHTQQDFRGVLRAEPSDDTKKTSTTPVGKQQDFRGLLKTDPAGDPKKTPAHTGKQKDFRGVLKTDPAADPKKAPVGGKQLDFRGVLKSDAKKSASPGAPSGGEQRDFRGVLKRKVTTNEKPKFLRFPENKEAIEGQNVTIGVKVMGTPTPKVTWLDPDGREIKDSALYHVTFDPSDQTSSLTVFEVAVAHGGTYVCRAENPGGTTGAGCLLAVYERRSRDLSMTPSDNQSEASSVSQDTDIGQDLPAEPTNPELDVSGPDSPDPALPSRKSDVNVSLGSDSGVDDNQSDIDPPGSTPEILSYDQHKPQSSFDQSFEVSELPPKDDSENPEPCERLSSSSSSSSSSTEEDIPEAEGRLLSPTEERKMNFKRQAELSLDDRAAMTEVGNTELVQEAPAVDEIPDEVGELPSVSKSVSGGEPPMIVSLQPSSINVLRGRGAALRGTFVGRPTPAVRWYVEEFRARTQINTDSHMSIVTGDGVTTLSIADTSDHHTGIYTLEISNELGSNHLSSSVTVEDTPDAPVSQPFVSNIRNTSLSLSWYGAGYDGGCPILHYRVQMKREKEADWSTLTDTCQHTSYNVEDLEASIGYEFRISAANRHGYSEPSKASDLVFTMEQRPEEADDGIDEPDFEPLPDEDLETSYLASTQRPEITVVPPCRERATPPARGLQRASGHLSPLLLSPPSGGGAGLSVETGGGGLHVVPCPLLLSSPLSPDAFKAARDELPFEPRVVDIDTTKKFEDNYSLGEQIGRGKFGCVYKCTDKSSLRQYAAKFIKAHRVSQKSDIKQEVAVMNALHHPKLLLLWDAYETRREVILVMEHVRGGELLSRVVDCDYILTERECIHFMRQICDGVRYMHANNIVHLDLKPENVMCITNNSNEIKIIDFGLARVLDPSKDNKVMFGTAEFVAPEVVNYDAISHGTDMWSVAVVCYILLSGLSPFAGDSDSETFSNVTMSQYDFDTEEFEAISDEAKDFINRLLKKDMRARLSAPECLSHAWLSQDVKYMRARRLSTEKHKRFLNRMKWRKAKNAVEVINRMQKSLSRLSMMSSSRSSESQDLGLSASPANGRLASRNTQASRESGQDGRQSARDSRLSSRSSVQEGHFKSRDDANNHSDYSSKVKDASAEIKDGQTGSLEIKDGRSGSIESTRSQDRESIASVSSSLSRESSTSSPIGSRIGRPRHTESPTTSSIDDVLAFKSSRLRDWNGISIATGRLRKESQEIGNVDAPKFLSEMKDYEVFEGNSAKFEVQLEPRSRARVTWYKDGLIVFDDGDKYVFNSDEEHGNYALIIKNCEQKDGCPYDCIVYNPRGEIKCSAMLHVEGE